MSANMIRGCLLLAASLEIAQSQCPDCDFDVTALEEFSIDYNVVRVNSAYEYWDGISNSSYNISNNIYTSPLPDDYPSEHGTIAVHARNLQLKVDSHVSFPSSFAVGSAQLGGMQIHEELHINGAADDGASGQASFHLASPIVNLCLRLDNLPPMAQIEHDDIEQQLQEAEQTGPQIAQQRFHHYNLDGEDVMGGPTLLFTLHSAPALINTMELQQDDDVNVMSTVFGLQPPPLPPQQPDSSLRYNGEVAVKFDNYDSSVGNQFDVRACGIEDHTSTKSLLAANPDARKFILNRITQQQTRLKALLQPASLNARFNFIPLDIADLIVPAAPHCTNDELAQIPGKAYSPLQASVFGVCSFMMGVAVTFIAIRKKPVTPAEQYHQLAA